MTTTPEVPIIPEVPQAPETLSEIPQAVEQGQMVQQQPFAIPRPTATANVAASQTTPAQTVTIPADPAQLTTLAKGNPVNALTWFANFWLRIIKKALGAGSNIMTSQSVSIPSSGDTGQAVSDDTNPADDSGQGDQEEPAETDSIPQPSQASEMTPQADPVSEATSVAEKS